MLIQSWTAMTTPSIVSISASQAKGSSMIPQRISTLLRYPYRSFAKKMRMICAMPMPLSEGA